jgi:hypothetical protein
MPEGVTDSSGPGLDRLIARAETGEGRTLEEAGVSLAGAPALPRL